MNRIEFMKELELLLRDLPEAEVNEALQFYTDYFDDAGAENENRVIEELVSPKRVARTIRDGFGGNDDWAGEYTERGYEDRRFKNNYTVPEVMEEAEPKHHRRSNKSNLLLIIVICVFAVPILWPITKFIIGFIIAAICILFAGVIAAGAVTVALLISGIIVFIAGIFQAAFAPATAIFACGCGLLLTAFGLFALAVSVLIYRRLLPAIIRGIVAVGERLIGKGRTTHE